MSVRVLVKSELLKLRRRKDVWLMLSMIGIPLLYALGAFLQASFIEYKAVEKAYALRFVMNMFQFNYGVFIFFFITLLVGVKTLGTEIEDKSIMLSIPRVKKRWMIYVSKNLAVSLMTLFINIIFGIACLGLYYAFLIHRTDLATTTLYKADELAHVIVNISAIAAFYLLLVQFASMLSTLIKPMVASVLGFIVITITLYLQQIPLVKYLMPGYYINQLSESTVEKWHLFGMYLICITVYALIFYTVGAIVFGRKDL